MTNVLIVEAGDIGPMNVRDQGAGERDIVHQGHLVHMTKRRVGIKGEEGNPLVVLLVEDDLVLVRVRNHMDPPNLVQDLMKREIIEKNLKRKKIEKIQMIHKKKMGKGQTHRNLALLENPRDQLLQNLKINQKKVQKIQKDPVLIKKIKQNLRFI